jgi:hypothetical protein
MTHQVLALLALGAILLYEMAYGGPWGACLLASRVTPYGNERFPTPIACDSNFRPAQLSSCARYAQSSPAQKSQRGKVVLPLTKGG